MNIAVIGTGNIGSTLAEKWAKKGHHIYLGVRDIKNFKGKQLADFDNVSTHSIADATRRSDIILIATPAEIMVQLITQMGDIENKIIIDATNAVTKTPNPYPTAFHAFADLTKAETVKCFNTTGWENMKDTQYGPINLDMFMAGDSMRAKAVAGQLAIEAGFENCYDFGGGAQVELLEQFALSWINLAIFQKMGRSIGLKLVKR